jgi:hypothetical protein
LDGVGVLVCFLCEPVDKSYSLYSDLKGSNAVGDAAALWAASVPTITPTHGREYS